MAFLRYDNGKIFLKGLVVKRVRCLMLILLGNLESIGNVLFESGWKLISIAPYALGFFFQERTLMIFGFP
jgi:hypothetical protein